MKNKNYPVDFKAKAVEMLKCNGKFQEQTAKELGISGSTMSKWRRQYDSGVFHNNPAKAQNSSDKEITRLG